MRRHLMTAALVAGFGLVGLASDASAKGCFMKKHHAPAPVCVVEPVPCPPPAPVVVCAPVKAKHKMLGKCFMHKAKPAC